MSCEKLNNLSLNKKILKELRLTSQEHMLFNCMDEFYNKKENTENAIKLIKLLEGDISIRLIDFFVTNFSNKNRINYKITTNDNTIVFNVYSSYKSQLKAWKKIHFDPFSRGIRIPFFLNDNNNCLLTTIGQLNFFKWFITNNISYYTKKNLEKLEFEMNKNKKISKINKVNVNSKPIRKYKEKYYKNYSMNNHIQCGTFKKKTKIEVRFD